MIAASPTTAQFLALQFGVYVVAFSLSAAIIFGGLALLRKRYKKLAGELGLQYSPRGLLQTPQLKGYFGDVEVTLTPRGNRRRSQGRGPQTVLEALVPVPLPYGLQLSREDFLFRLGKAFGGEEIELGDAEFDKSFKIYGEDVPAVQVLLRNGAVRAALLAFLSRHKNIAIESNRITVVFARRLDENVQEAAAALWEIANLARALATAQGMFMPPLPQGGALGAVMKPPM